MAWAKLAVMAEAENNRDRERWIGVYIAILAVMLAICGMGGGNASKDAAKANLDSANTWAFFQAKNARRQMIRLQADEFEALLLAEPAMPDAARQAIQAKIDGYKKLDLALTSDPEKPEGQREGLDQLFEKGKALEAARDVSMRRDPYFDYGEACLQIAIVLASVAIITNGAALIWVSAVLGLLGALLTANGFTLMVAVPWIG